jgi:hypothetical protein
VDAEAARRAVAEALPYYCVPAFVLAMDEFPITSRGKVDKRALLALARDLQPADPAAPQANNAAPRHELVVPVLAPAFAAAASAPAGR